MIEQLTALGLMSGTSMDGVDAAILVSDGESVARHGPWLSRPYRADLRARLRSVLGGHGEVETVGEAITRVHAETVNQLLQENALSANNIDVIGFHGHTILHQPEAGRTWQIGDGGLLARLCDIDAVDDFRSADVAEGGQGAPLAPLYHEALARDMEKPLAVLNLGGVANLTWIGRNGPPIAFDTGPGNALIDDWMSRRAGQDMDMDGAMAVSGRVDESVLATLLANDYFARPAPKSLDRDAFRLDPADGLDAADGVATLTAFTVHAVAAALAHLPAPPRRWLVTGGGRRNRTLMGWLSRLLTTPVEPVEAVGWRGDALEAEAFAFLALRSLRGLHLSLPSTTGVGRLVSGGRLHRAPTSTNT